MNADGQLFNLNVILFTYVTWHAKFTMHQLTFNLLQDNHGYYGLTALLVSNASHHSYHCRRVCMHTIMYECRASAQTLFFSELSATVFKWPTRNFRVW